MTEIFMRKARTPYRSPINFEGEESRTKQSFKDESDIKQIIARHKKGIPLPEALTPPSYGDFTNVPDYQEAVDRVRAAKQAFDAIPSDLRKRLDQSPAKFIEFVNDPENHDELVKYGLANPIPKGDPASPSIPEDTSERQPAAPKTDDS